jgi:integrase
MRLVDVRPDKIQGWYNRKVADTSSGTANTTLNLLCAIFNRATDWDMFSAVNPVRKVLTEEDPEPRTRFLSAEEIKAFFAACDERLLPIVAFALLTGLRKSESLDFRWEDVDLERASIKAHRGKKGINPDIPAPDKLCALLRHLGPRKQGRLFDLCPMTFRRLFDKARESCGVEHFTWHDLRRTFGSHFAMATKDLPSLRKLLGHRTNFMVNRYAYLTDDHLRTQMVAFDATMPELPAALRKFVPVEVGHHPSHQAISAEAAK